MTSTATDALTLDELEDELATLAAQLAAGMCRWLDLVGELDRRGNWAEAGHGSCAEWLAWRCALTPRAAREHVRVARCLAELPQMHAAFARGELSYAKVRALTRVADAASEGELIELASALTAAQLERAVSASRRVSTEEARDLHANEHFTASWDADGSLVIRGRLAPEDAALFMRALEAACASLWERGNDGECGSAEPRPKPTHADALVAMADASLAGNERSGCERYQVVVHVDADTLAGDEASTCQLDDGPAIAAETARRLACDASVVRMSERRGRTLSVGRKTRSIPPALRRALTARDRTCRFPGCERRRFVDAHHIHHWAKGGTTDLDNLVRLCRRHHRLVHEGGYAVDDRIRFYDPKGRVIPAVGRPARADPDALLDAGSAIGARTCRHGDGERMNFGLVVDALLQTTRR